jgi:hypothetical protein
VVSAELMLTESTKNRRAAVDNSGLGRDVATSVRRGFFLLLIATLVASLMAGLVADTADAKKHKKKKKPKLQTSTSTVTFGNITVGNNPLPQEVTIKNNTGKELTVQPTVVGDGFTLVEEDAIKLAPEGQDGDTEVVQIDLLSDILGDLLGDLDRLDLDGVLTFVDQDGNVLELVDKETGKTVKEIDLLASVTDLL